VCVSGSAQKVFRKKCSLLALLIICYARNESVCEGREKLSKILLWWRDEQTTDEIDRYFRARRERSIDRSRGVRGKKKPKKIWLKTLLLLVSTAAAAEFVITRPIEAKKNFFFFFFFTVL
jgi:hypothetical protein